MLSKTRVHSLLVGGLLSACAHSVFSLDVEERMLEEISACLKSECPAEACALGNCWRETADLVVCDVDVASRTNDQKQSLLQRVRSKLADGGVGVGFCAHDSLSSRLASAMVRSFVAGALSGGRSSGGYNHDHVEAIGPEAQIQRACASLPVR